jgi:hypothetical protein
MSSLFNDHGIAVTTEYVLLLGVSLAIFSAVYIGFNSFYQTAASDARAESATEIAMYVSGHISGLAGGDKAVVQEIDLPDRINGDGYVVYPSRDGREICVMAGRDHTREYSSPIVCGSDVEIKGFMVSGPDEHRLAYDPSTSTVTLA